MKNISDTVRQETVSDDLSMMYLTFQIARQHYGIPIGNVIEILQIQPGTELPDLPHYSKGIINLRGQVIPLIDVTLRFGMQEKEYTNRTCIIIADTNGLHTGLIVDAVEEVLTIGNGMTSKPPSFSADGPSNYITRIAKMDKNTVLLLDVCALVLDSDLNAAATV